MGAGQWTTTGSMIEEEKEENKEGNPYLGSRSPGQSIFMKNFSLVSNSCPKIHKEVKSMVVDQNRNYLYSSGGEKIIHCQDLVKKCTVGNIKCSNCHPLALEIDVDLQRIYCATKEGLVLLFDIKLDFPVMIHSIKLVKTRDNPQPIGANFVKNMDLDQHRNILICQMKQG